MEIKDLNIKVQKAFGNLYRKRLALIAVQDLDGKILTGLKPDFYPEGISRMIGGGIDEDEDEKLGAVRELKEELDITISQKDLTLLLQVNVHAEDEKDTVFDNSTFVYLYKLEDNNFEPGDDIKGVVKLTLNELFELGEKYEALPDDYWFKDGERQHAWGDYGKVYGPIHKFTAEKIKLLNL